MDLEFPFSKGHGAVIHVVAYIRPSTSLVVIQSTEEEATVSEAYLLARCEFKEAVGAGHTKGEPGCAVVKEGLELLETPGLGQLTGCHSGTSRTGFQ